MWRYTSWLPRTKRFPCSLPAQHRLACAPQYPALGTLRMFRVAGFERMLILYRPLEDGADILRIVHGSRKLQALFRRREEIE
jgi:hypothetical protein